MTHLFGPEFDIDGPLPEPLKETDTVELPAATLTPKELLELRLALSTWVGYIEDYSQNDLERDIRFDAFKSLVEKLGLTGI